MHLIDSQVAPSFMQDTVASGPMGPPGAGARDPVGGGGPRAQIKAQLCTDFGTHLFTGSSIMLWTWKLASYQ